MLNLFAAFLLVTAGTSFAYARGLRHLHALQQDEYTPERFWEWFKQHRAYDKRGTGVAFLLAVICSYFSGTLGALFSLAGAVALFILARREPNPLLRGKVKLVMTERARSILLLASIAYMLLLFLIFVGFAQNHTLEPLAKIWVFQILLFQLIPFFFLLGVSVLQPFENRRQANFLNNARRRLDAINPYVVGITGSYGKTSTKNLLGELMQITLAPTFWPPRGINTLMGNTRAIREHLNEHHRYAIIEMAAYREGSIQKLSELTKPKAAIITAIGEMHLERFGNLETIYRAKTELARAIPQDGILLCNGDNEGARRAAEEFQKKTTLLYGFDGDTLDCKMSDISFSASGSSFTLRWKNKSYFGSTGLLGKPALSNLLAAFAMSCTLGSDPEFILGALKNVRPIDNRLSVKDNGKAVFLNDAYNSNPIGFAAALEVLRQFPAKRRILVTPGMIELGNRQAEANAAIARTAAKICDLVFIVGDTNRRALRIGLEESDFGSQNVHFFPERDIALKELISIQRAGDVILIENDLPDWYEQRDGF